MRDKGETGKLVRNFMAFVKNQFGKNVKIIHSDNGAEFISNPMKQFYAENGIIHQTSCVDTAQQNGRLERKHRHVLNVGRALRFHASLPLKFWGECVLTAAYLINRTPTKILQGKTPYECLFGIRPSYDNFRIFGCLYYAQVRQKPKEKFAARSRRCMFIGYPFGKKGWKLYDLESKEIFVSRDVIFYEDIFPFISANKNALQG